MASTEAALSLPWYRSLSGPQWKTLVAANLSWTLDSFEFFALALYSRFPRGAVSSRDQWAAFARRHLRRRERFESGGAASCC